MDQFSQPAGLLSLIDARGVPIVFRFCALSCNSLERLELRRRLPMPAVGKTAKDRQEFPLLRNLG